MTQRQTPKVPEHNGGRQEFLERMSNELNGLYERLSKMGPFIANDIKAEDVDRICGQLTILEKEASRAEEPAKAKVLGKLNFHFYNLNTVGHVVNYDTLEEGWQWKRDKKEVASIEEAITRRNATCALIMDIMETALLTMDSVVSRNRGRILRTLEAQRQDY